MIPVSQNFQNSLNNDVQIVRPKVTAWMSDLRSLNNVKVNTTTHSYEKQILDRNPQMYVKFDKSNFDSTSGIFGPTITTSVTFTNSTDRVNLTSHGLLAGTAVSFSTAGTLPAGITAGTVYYVQEVLTNSFCLNIYKSYALINNAFGKVNFTTDGSENSITYYIINFTNSTERINIVSHSLPTGTAVSFSTTGTLPAGITAGQIYYVQEVLTNSFCLNYYREAALDNSSYFKVYFSTDGSGPSTMTYYNTRLQDHGEQKLSFGYGSSTTGVPVSKNGYYSILSDAITSKYKQIFEPKRLIDIFNRYDANSLGFFTSSDTSDLSMQYYSWQTSDQNWIISSNQAKYISNNYTNNNIHYMKCNIKSLDHFVDFKTNATPGTRAYVRFVDDTHYVSLNTTTSTNTGIWVNNGDVSTMISVNPTVSISNGTPCVITLNNHGLPAGTLVKFYTSGTLPTGITAGTFYYVQNPTTNNFNLNTIRANAISNSSTGRINTSSAGSGTHQMSFGLQTDHYYRLQAKYNLYYFYDMGTSEPTNSSSGTLLYSGYHDYNEIFKTDDARNVALGFSGAQTYGGTSYYQFDYFASYGFDYLAGAHYFNNDKYTYASTTLDSTTSSQFNAINNSSNFTYSFMFQSSSTDTKETIFWLGDSLQKTAIRACVNYSSPNRFISVKVCNLSGTITTLTSSTNLSNSTMYHIAIIKNGTKLSLYINNTEDCFTTLASDFVLRDVTTGLIPYFVFGADYAGTTLGDSSDYRLLNGYISEFAMFDYALTNSDLNSLYYCIENQATLPVDTIDKYFNAECIVDGILEETLQFAVTNMLDSHGSIIKSNNDIYCMSADTILTTDKNFEDNYGWMSRVKSDSDKVFGSNPDFVEITFDIAKCNKIFVSTGYLNGRTATFNYVITKSDLSIISGGKSFGDNSYVYISPSDLGLTDGEYLDIISIKIIPTATVNALDYARLYSINPIWEVDLSDYVVSYKVSKVRENFDASLPIGATSANNGSLVLDNSSLDFNVFGDTLYGAYTTPDVPLFISLDYELPEYGITEEIVLTQEMYADTWSFDNSSMTVNVTFRDYSKYLQEKTLKGYVGQEITAGRGIMNMLLLSGFPRRKIIINDKYESSILSDDPYVYLKINESIESITASFGKFEDQCNYVYMGDMYFNYIDGPGVCNNSLIYSEIIDVQDDTNRPNYQNILSTFEPNYKEGSYKIGLPGEARIYLKQIVASSDLFQPIDTTTKSWGTELFHFVDPNLSTSSGSKITIFRPNNDLAGSVNYLLQYEYTPTQIKYYWSFYDNTNTIHTISSDWLDRTYPHLIHVRKIGGILNVYNLFIDGVKVATMSPNVTIAPITSSFGVINTFVLVDNQGYVSNISFYNYALTDDRIIAHYISSSLVTLPTFKYIYASDQTYWDAMLNIATADLGMFYIDEYGIFNYEYRNTLHESKFDRYQNSQYNFSDSTDILNGKFVTEIQSNKVTVTINKAAVKSNTREALWTAPNNTSLVVSLLTNDLTPYSTFIQLDSTSDPIWLSSGYVKIDDEIIKYGVVNGNTLNKIERGQFGTSVDWHKSGSKAREGRYFNMIYSSNPAVDVAYPLLIKGGEANPDVDIDFFYSNSYYTDMFVSAKNTVASGNYYYLNGTQDGIDRAFEISGIPVSNSSSKELISNISTSINSNIRKYGIKELKIDNSYIQNKNYAQLVADFVIGYYTEPVKILNIEVLGVPHLQLGDLITIDNFADLGIFNKKYWIIQNDIDYDGAIKQSLSLRSYTDTIDPPPFVFGAGSSISAAANTGHQYFPSGF